MKRDDLREGAARIGTRDRASLGTKAAHEASEAFGERGVPVQPRAPASHDLDKPGRIGRTDTCGICS